MKRVLTNLLVATTFLALASPAVAEKYIYQCKGSSSDSLILTTKKPHHETHWDACGKRFYFTNDKVKAIKRKCGSSPYRIKTHDRTAEICRSSSW